MILQVSVRVVGDDGTPAYTDVHRCGGVDISDGALIILDFDDTVDGEYADGEWDHIEIKPVTP